MNRPLDPSDPDDEALSSEFAHLLEEFERGAASARQAERAAMNLSPGAKVRGKVIAIAADHALIDVGARSEATADLADLRNEDESLRIAVGDVIDLFVVEAGEQIVLAGSVRADPKAGLAALRDARAAGMPVSGRVTGVNSGGLQVDLGGVRGFCPVSQIESGYCADASAYVGRSLEFLVTALEEGRRSAVLSRRQLLRRQEEELARRRLAELKPGAELEGTVWRLEPLGAFVDLGGVEGMVHVSEVRHGRTAHPRDVLREGESVRVRVLRIDQDRSGRPRLALSIKAAAPDPWAAIESRYAPGSRVKGIVASLADFGAFVTLEPGIDGLVHVSEIASRRTERVRDVLTLGQEVEAIVLGVEAEKKRISLSIRAAMVATEDAEPEAEPPPSAPAQAAIADEPTTMAIALRKAAEKARQKQVRGSTEA